MKREESLLIDKSYVPKMGDVLYNDVHPLVTIEGIYSLNKTSVRVNKSYNLELLKGELLTKIINRKEAIWSQHKKDLDLFPEKDEYQRTIDREDNNNTYRLYCYYNDFKQYQRLYVSKYNMEPSKKLRVVTGKKTMVVVNHALCKSYTWDAAGEYIRNICPYWGGRQSRTLSSMVSQGFKYLGNVYQDILEEDIRRKVSY